MSKVFTAASHERFAALSGDRNPMHMDAVAARRTLAGAPVVHGVHTLLWLLDTLAERHPHRPLPSTLKARFRKMVYVGDTVGAEIVAEGAIWRARASVEEAEVVSVSVGFGAARAGTGASGAAAPGVAIASAAPSALPTAPLEFTLDQLRDRHGRVRVASSAAAVELFPHAAAWLGAPRVAALMGLSALVGMVVPGLHSMFGGFDLQLSEADGAEAPAAEALDYAVRSVDERFRLVRVAVRAAGLAGTLETLCRPPPMQQPPLEAIAARVQRGEFVGTVALIVGGSRGLGEVTAKLIAAGGGELILTYQRGRAEAEAVAAQISGAGGRVQIASYDALQPAAPQLRALRTTPTQAYYFATPPIGRRKRGLFDPRRLQEFNAYYADGFFDLAQALLECCPGGIDLFYPSSVYVEQRPAELTEYAMAKAAGEVLCTDLAALPGLRLRMRRLPRLPTDQTSSIVPVQSADAVEVMLAAVRDMHTRRV